MLISNDHNFLSTFSYHELHGSDLILIVEVEKTLSEHKVIPAMTRSSKPYNALTAQELYKKCQKTHPKIIPNVD